MHFSEFGVVLLLFIIGLELQPSRLWVLRKSVFGLGSAQVLITTGILTLAGILFGLSLQAAFITGFGLSLSSTAFVLQILAERNQLTTRYGRSSFAILLFQDLAVIPVLALMPLLVANVTDGNNDPLWLMAIRIVAVLLIIVVGGRYLLRPLFRLVAISRTHEIFTAATLLVVIGTALLMDKANLSMSLGAFLAGVLLADSEFRHELEANIEPFEGLLLGLFFISVGMSANIGLFAERPWQILGITLGLMAVKSTILFALGKFAGHTNEAARNLAFALPQGGEFAFVLFGTAITYHLMERPLADFLVVVVSLSMALTPLAFIFNHVILKSWFGFHTERPFDSIDSDEPQVIIAGFGRFGQIIGRILRVKRIPFTALDQSATQVDFVRKFGNKVYYGDASRLDLLRAAKADKAKIFVLAIDDVTASLKTAQMVREHFPNLTIYARARNRFHTYQLMDLGVTIINRETFLSSLDMAKQVLEGLSISPAEAQETIEKFKAHDEKALLTQHAVHHDETKLIQSAKEAAKELESLFESDKDTGSETK